MRETLFLIIRSPIQIGLGGAALGVVILVLALVFSSARWLRCFGVSLAAASIVALLPTLITYVWAWLAAGPGGGDFRDLGFLFVPIIFFVVWLPALPVSFLIAISSPVIQRLGHHESNNNSRNA
jgi:hypothetical protein